MMKKANSLKNGEDKHFIGLLSDFIQNRYGIDDEQFVVFLFW